MANIGMMWIGNPLTKIELLSINSFLYYGHDVTVYLYDQSIELPDGVKKEDANNIVHESKIFKLHGTVSTFSDYFRYKMIKQTGKVWADMDTICLSADWNFGSKTYASATGDGLVQSSPLSIDQNSNMINFLIEKSEDFYNRLHEENLNYRQIGSILLTEAFLMFGYSNNIMPLNVLVALAYGDAYKLWNPSYLNEILNLNSKAISIYNSDFRFKQENKNLLPDGSALDYFYKKFVLKTE